MTEIARRYAIALYDTGAEEAALMTAATALQENKLLWDALLSPAVRGPEKQQILQSISQTIGDERLLHFLLLLTQKGRLMFLPEIAEAFHRHRMQQRGGALCLVRCVHIPTAQQQQIIARKLCRVHQKEFVEFSFVIDKSLLGGFVLEICGIRYDRSILGRLQGLSRQLEEVTLG